MATHLIVQGATSNDREPLPAGHPESWGAINAGTWLANSPYLLPRAMTSENGVVR